MSRSTIQNQVIFIKQSIAPVLPSLVGTDRLGLIAFIIDLRGNTTTHLKSLPVNLGDIYQKWKVDGKLIALFHK